MRHGTFLASVGLAALLLGCNPSAPADAQEPSAGSGKPAVVARAATRAQVTRIVFVGKEEACACTRARVDGSWAELQKALGEPARLPVERLQIDTQPERVQPYRSQRPIMALPAVYFLDASDGVVAMLQGEVSEQQVRAELDGKGAVR